VAVLDIYFGPASGGASLSGHDVKEGKMKRVLALVSTLVLLGLTGTISAEAATTAAPGPAFCGALNMLHDATMFTIPMAKDAPQGNAGMFIAVGKSC
jgi:hypothetical protein